MERTTLGPNQTLGFHRVTEKIVDGLSIISITRAGCVPHYIYLKIGVWFGEISCHWQCQWLFFDSVTLWERKTMSGLVRLEVSDKFIIFYKHLFTPDPPPSHGYAFEPQAQIMPPPNWNDNCSLTPRNSDFVIINFPFAERNRSIQFNQRFH